MNHILYSISSVSSFIFTRNSRCTLLLACWCTQMAIQAIFYKTLDKDEWGWTILFAIASVFVSKFIQLFYGNFLYNDYKQ